MSARPLRSWQREAFEQYQRTQPRDFLTVATPGAGKTTFALTIAADLLHRRVVERVVVVAPTEHLKTQWALSAAAMGISLDPDLTGALAPQFQGYAVTYAGLATNPIAHRVRVERQRTLVIIDEIHHAGDALSWGEAVQEACEPAERRLALTGTPFRSDDNPIPFVTYAPQGDGSMASVADYSYGYGAALRDSVVRPVLFMAYSGQMQWRTSAGDEVSARLGEPLTRDQMAHALRTALDPQGSWIPAVLQAAHRRLQEVRRDIPDAGGLVIATDQTTARAYAAILRELTGSDPTVVLSDEAGSSQRIQDFSAGSDPWMVAVRMVSEGVDVPRLAVGVYATTTATPLFFAQAVGRFVRARRRGETASIFVPSVPGLLGLAADLEAERDHVIGRPVKDEADLFAAEAELLARANREEPAMPEELGTYRALGSDASFDRVVYDGGEFGYDAIADDPEELDFLGIPGLLEPDQVAELLRSARSKKARDEIAQRAAAPSPADEDVAFERRSELRRELNALVGSWHHRTGTPHGVVHNKLRSECGGPPAAAATTEQLQHRIDRLREWALRASG
ncbi:DEAD/DEAH box helicase [Aeromicrobium sp. YIM 150415]|uniref:DEAD/DEAH box helicase n=1 Tax=Aeromicrobium piscarium TaxID=2590901 RepID=A0A554RUR8_9ACTN|nr:MULTISPECIES: DEAD/DEAH box helicase [Aeromicrobium]MBM9463133.1 DEAD/DEAH box helicase [Aeromicrobium sp. YIM 150415]TSD57846.1 DEAD/DEAH box helicase [Aeromicrobium piscarium]